MAKKKSSKASKTKTSVKVRDLKTNQNPKGGIKAKTSLPMKWELSEYDAVKKSS